MTKIDFVDTHIHLYDMQHPELYYGHWQPGVPHPSLGDQIQKLAERNYLAEDYIAETRNANVTKTVHVQAAIGTKEAGADCGAAATNTATVTRAVRFHVRFLNMTFLLSRDT